MILSIVKIKDTKKNLNKFPFLFPIYFPTTHKKVVFFLLILTKDSHLVLMTF